MPGETPPTNRNHLSTAARYAEQRRAHWDAVAQKMDSWSSWGRFYARRLSKIYRFLIPPGQRVLELGCGTGDLLASLMPGYGLGIDLSPEMVARAKENHLHLEFIAADAHTLDLGERGSFDYIILSDLVNDLYDVYAVLQKLKVCTHARTRIILNYYSRVWELPLALARRLGLAKANLPQNWLTTADIHNLLHLAGFEVIRSWHEVLLPLPVPLLAAFCNRILVKLSPIDSLGLANFTLARPAGQPVLDEDEPLVSVVIPARNEAGNIAEIIANVPEMGRGTELVFVEGHSKDDTYQVIADSIAASIAAHPERRAVLLKQSGIGKANAVQEGFAAAQGEVVMILDADLSVSPQDLTGFYHALRQGKGDFINGVRLVYPMEKEAMRPLNFLGNKFFSVIFSALISQQIKDTLCGTKVLWKQDYELIAANRAYFGDFDPFGDFDLILGAVRLNRKLVDFPVRYRARSYGATNIQRWQHGWLLLKMVWLAARRIKFV